MANSINTGNGLTRRGLLAGAALTAAAGLALPAPAIAQNTRKTFVLVHGAWHGGW